MTYTDYTVLTLGLLFFWGGWRKGFFRTLIGPLSLGIFAIFGALNYDINENLFKAVMITLVGSLCLSIVLRILLMIGRASADKKYRDEHMLISRFLGGMINLAWKGIVLAGILYLVTYIPFNFLKLDMVKEDILQSRTMGYLGLVVEKKTNAALTLQKMLTVIENPNQLQSLSETAEYKAFASDPKAQAIINDPEIQTLIKNRDFARLLGNPKIRAVITDENLTKKLSKLSERIYAESKSAEPTPPPR